MARAAVLAGGIGLFTIAPMVSAAEPDVTGPAGVQIAGPVLLVTDLERSLHFYVNGLGLSIAARLPGNPGPGATVVGAGGGKSPFVLLRQRDQTSRLDPPIAIGDGLSRIMLTVPDAKATEARLTSAGYAPTVPNDRSIFFVKDPDGYSYEVMQIPQPR